eukprot:7193084-Prymnesium_polylepis.1
MAYLLLLQASSPSSSTLQERAADEVLLLVGVLRPAPTPLPRQQTHSAAALAQDLGQLVHPHTIRHLVGRFGRLLRHSCFRRLLLLLSRCL